MQNRIFPNNTEVDMGSKLVFNSIDWTEVEDNMHNQKFANSHTEQIKSLLKLAGMDAEAEDHEGKEHEDKDHEEAETEDLDTEAGLEKSAQGFKDFYKKYKPLTVDEVDDFAPAPRKRDFDLTFKKKPEMMDEAPAMMDEAPAMMDEDLDMMDEDLDMMDEDLDMMDEAPAGEDVIRITPTRPSFIKDIKIDINNNEMEAIMESGGKLKHYIYHIDNEDPIYQEFLEYAKQMTPESSTSAFWKLARPIVSIEDAFEVASPTMASAKTNTRKAMKKIAFTHPNQISAEAIEQAKAAGDTKLVNTILAARKANRQRIASAIQAKMQDQNELAQRVAKREALLKKVVASSSEYGKMNERALEEMINKAGGFKKSSKALQDAYLSKTASRNLDLDFVSPTEFTKAQREAFNKIAQANGFPKEYINVMCAPVISPEVESLAQEARTIYSSNLSDRTKKTLLSSLIKEAELSNESKAAFIKYWNEDLGYQAKDFWPDVAANYTEGHKGK
jgi:predicted metal-binding transcription factor (methanogenesis marker protein 9)